MTAIPELELEMKEKILIVDDEEAIRNLFVEALTGLGYRCEIAVNGA